MFKIYDYLEHCNKLFYKRCKQIRDMTDEERHSKFRKWKAEQEKVDPQQKKPLCWWKLIKRDGKAIQDELITYPKKFVMPTRKQLEVMIIQSIREFRKILKVSMQKRKARLAKNTAAQKKLKKAQQS